MEFIQANWVAISAVVLSILRVIESILVEQNNTKAVTIIGVIKQFFTLG